MRNLKRVLSLALATAMLLGMMVVGASAADKKPLTDIDTVTNKEAVNLMVDLGIIAGKPDGSFAPTETVDRATMAKLITYIMMGDVDANLFKGTKTDLTDIDSNWAEGYIKYCYANNIITGDGMGHFFPGNKVTTVQAAKMLLVALNYDATAQGYVGNGWSVNIMRDAQKNKLLDGVTAGTNDELTRDNAAKMIYNALFCQTVTYSIQYDQGIGYKTNPTPGTNPTLGTTAYNLVVVAPATLTANEYNAATAKGYSVIGGQTVPVATNLDQVGKKVNYYTFTKDGKTAYSSTAFVNSDVRVVSVPSNLVSATPSATQKLTTAWLSENGLRESASGTPRYVNYVSQVAITNGNLEAAIEDGTITSAMKAYVIDNDKDGVIDALVVNSQIVDFVTGDVKTATSGGNTTVYVPGVTTGYLNTANVVGYEDLKKDDVVMAMTVGTTTYIVKAASFEGKITGQNASKNTVSIDGTAYDVSAMTGGYTTYTKYTDLGYTQTCTFYKDDAGKLIYATAPEAVKSSYGVVLGYESSAVTNASGTALLLTSDGATETVKVNSNSTAVLTGANDPQAPAKFVYVSYSLNDDGTYTFTAPKNATDSGALSSRYITKGSANYIMGTAANAGGFGGNASTIFVVAQKNTAGKITGYASFTGIANAPAYSGDAAGRVIHDANNIAKLVVITGGTQTYAGTGSFFYATDIANANYDSAAKTYTVDAFLDGVKQNVVVKSAVYTSMVSNTLYAVTVDNDVVTGASSQAWTASSKVGIKYTDGTLIIDASGAPAYLSLADNATIFLKDGTTVTTINAASIMADTNDTVDYLTNSSGKVIVVFITKVANDDDTLAELAARFTSVKYGTNATEATAVSNAGTTAFTMSNATLSGITVAANDFLALEAIVAADATNPCNITIKIEGVGTAPSAPVTLTIPATAAGDTVTSVAGSNTYKILAGTTSLKLTVTITDGDTEFVQVYTSAVTITP